MWRTYNAQFLPGTAVWSIPNTSLPSYATVQNPDGSIHYYTWDRTTSQWVGSGNNAVYNAVDYGLSTGDMTGVDNQAALQAVVDAVINSGLAGIVYISGGSYNIAGPVIIDLVLTPGSDTGIIIAWS
jgi:hypothetical protein